MGKAKITEQTFKAVKQLTAGKATINECAKYFNIAHATVSRIRAAETFEEYLKTARKPSEPKKEPEVKEAVVNPTVVKVEATHYMMQELQRTNELLTGISAKLAQIVSDLYGVK